MERVDIFVNKAKNLSALTLVRLTDYHKAHTEGVGGGATSDDYKTLANKRV